MSETHGGVGIETTIARMSRLARLTLLYKLHGENAHLTVKLRHAEEQWHAHTDALAAESADLRRAEERAAHLLDYLHKQNGCTHYCATELHV